METGRLKKTKKWLLLGFLVIFLGFGFAYAFFVFKLVRTGEWKNHQPVTVSDKAIDEKTLNEMTKNSYWIGSSQPKITIIEFGDFSCSQCKASFSTIREITTRYKDDVKFIFKDFPVVSANSGYLALAARCAGEQGLFWPMYDKLYIKQGIGTKDELVELAKQIGVNTTRFTSCFDKKKYEKEIMQDYSDGEALKVAGTPTWFINGIEVQGSIPRDYFITMIENLLKK